MFKLSYGTNGYRNYRLQEVIQKVSQFGYGGIDLMADRPHAYPPDLNTEERQTLRRTLEQLGLGIANINSSSVSAIYEEEIKRLKAKGTSLPSTLWEFCTMYEPSFVSPSEDARKKRVQYIKQCIDLAADLRATNISTFSGIRLPMMPPEEAWDWLVAGLKECLDYAEQRKIKIALEPEPFHVVEHIADLSLLLEQIDSDWLGVNLDIGHTYCVDGSVPDRINEVRGKIIHVHIEDIKARKHYHLIPGEGDMGEEGLREVINALKASGYAGFLTAEIYTYDAFPDFAAKQAIENLRKVIGQD